jgi:hypothetical protein
MKTPITLLVASILVLLLAAWTVRGDATLDKPKSSPTDTERIERKIEEPRIIPLPEYLNNKNIATQDTKEFDKYLEGLWNKSSDNLSLEDRLIRGIMRSRVPEGGVKPRWERCGKVVPDDKVIEEARNWIRIFTQELAGIKTHFGMDTPVWGAFAVMANESGFNECSLDFYSRLWASRATDKFLIEQTWHGKTVKLRREQKVVEKFQLTYDRDTVWRIVTCNGFKTAKVEVKDPKNPGKKKWVNINGKFDGGPFQQRFSSKNLSREKFDWLMSVDGGISGGIKEMARRALGWQQRYNDVRPHPRPWKLWPARYLSPKGEVYDSKIIAVARWLGATREEIDPRFMEKKRN